MTRLLLFAGAIAISRAQTPDFGVCRFDVASIHPHKDTDQFGGLSAQNGTFRSIYTNLKFLIMGAYELQEFQVSGGPGWMATEWYDVVAKTENIACGKEMMKMVRPLLADRF